MEDWDEDKLAEVVNKKHGAEKSTQTDIICKFFLDAVENNKYGWFWECPDKATVLVKIEVGFVPWESSVFLYTADHT
jgi:hypothetical protein